MDGAGEARRAFKASQSHLGLPIQGAIRERRAWSFFHSGGPAVTGVRGGCLLGEEAAQLVQGR
eukprot:3442869-Alexandrium_andersonii.AAC.1